MTFIDINDQALSVNRLSNFGSWVPFGCAYPEHLNSCVR